MKFDKSRRPSERTRPPESRYSEPGPTSGLIRLYGRKPVVEAMRMGVVKRIEIARGAHGRIIDELLANAKSADLDVRVVEDWIDDETTNSQGIRAYASLPELRRDLRQFAESFEQDEQPLFLMLDGVTDPHNFGAILRTAVAAQVAAVIVRERRQAPVTDVVVKTSAGLAYQVPLFVVNNLTHALRDLTERGFWSAAATGEAFARPFTEYDWARRLVLIVGAEGTGVSDLLLRSADDLIRIPLPAQVESLNVSVATGVLLFEALRHRQP